MEELMRQIQLANEGYQELLRIIAAPKAAK